MGSERGGEETAKGKRPVRKDQGYFHVDGDRIIRFGCGSDPATENFCFSQNIRILCKQQLQRRSSYLKGRCSICANLPSFSFPTFCLSFSLSPPLPFYPNCLQTKTCTKRKLRQQKLCNVRFERVRNKRLFG